MGKGDYDYESSLAGKSIQFTVMDEMHTYRSDKFYDVVKALTSKRWKSYVNPGRCNGKTNFQLELYKHLINEGEKDMHIGSHGISVNYNGHKYWAKEVTYDRYSLNLFPRIEVLLEPSPAFLVDDNDNDDVPKIVNVIFNPPATIVFWSDGDKTVVQARGDEFDPEKGLAMAISRKFLGNKFDYYNIFKHWLKRAPVKKEE